MLDPVETNPEHYRVTFENEFVRVLDYHDEPGDRTEQHDHPDSVMYTLTSFHRRLYAADRELDVAMDVGTTAWLPAQRHAGHNIGETSTHVMFVELKGHGAGAVGETGPRVAGKAAPASAPGSTPSES